MQKQFTYMGVLRYGADMTFLPCCYMCLLSATDVGLNNQKISTSSCVLPAEKDYKAFAGNSFTSIDFALKLKERSTRDGMDQEKWQRKL